MKYYIKKENNIGYVCIKDKFSDKYVESFQSEFDLLKILARISLAFGDRVKTTKITNSEGYEYTLDKYSPAIHGI